MACSRVDFAVYYMNVSVLCCSDWKLSMGSVISLKLVIIYKVVDFTIVISHLYDYS
jgi:hypothetical protein